MNRVSRNESGFVLPTAIFLLVILAALGGYMVSLSRTSHLSSALDLQGGRAYQAARAGIEWGAWQVIDPQNLQPVPTPCPASPTTLTLTGTLATFTVNVSCTQTLAPDGADTIAIYQVTSTAIAGVAGEPDYVERQIQASFSK
ncbi:MAG: biosis protein MshP [Pseudomonadota bacterium]|nr:biosis protein MshP [Pseudomonadota bacterium]